MSNYTKTTNFAAKDSLPSGNAAKIVKGAEIDTEFNNIATASATKANANNAALTGTTVFATLSDGTIAITGWVDEDNMASNSAVLIPTQQSVKAYVDSNVTAQDLDVTDGTTSIDIDLDSESLGILGGTGVTSTASGTGVTLAIDSTVATLTGTQTLSNKTLTTPVISGALTTNSTIDGRDVAVDGTKLDGIESGATADQTAAEIKTAYESNANTNAFTDADESKLDGIEASADVTDTTNVTAAGALMDSELTNITAVKALNQGVATGDSPTFAAVNAPLTGNVTGNLTGNVTGNVTGDLTGDVTGNVTGNVSGNLTGSVLTAAQTNITSVGTLGSLDISGNLNVVQSGGYLTGFNVDVNNQRVSLWTSNPTVSLDMGGVTNGIRLPVGTTGQRPTGAAGMFRYNSSLEQFEGYTSEWGSIGGGGGTNTFTTDSFTGNGSTTAYALSQVTSSEDNLLVFIEGVFQQQDAYSIATSSGATTLTFSAAPANGNAILIYSVAAAVSGSNLNIDSMTGDGSDTTLTLSIAPVNENNTQVFIDGVYQSKANYSISGTTLTFSTAPPTGTAVEVMTFTQTDINVPVDGTITSAKLSGDLTLPGSLTFADSEKAIFGAGSDLQIYHDGSHSRIVDAGTGNLSLQGNDLRIKNSDASATYIQAANGGAVTIHHNNAIALTTTATGIDVTGTATMDGLTVTSSSSNAGTFKAVGGYALQAYQDATSANHTALELRSDHVSGGTDRYLIRGYNTAAGTPVESFNVNTAGGATFSGNVGIGTISPNVPLHVDGDAKITGAYSSTTGFGANVFVQSTGKLFRATSSQRYKNTIQDATHGLTELLTLRPVTYKGNNDGDTVFGGLIAEEVHDAGLTEFVQYNDEDEPDALAYGNMVSLCIKAIQEQNALITALTARVAELEG